MEKGLGRRWMCLVFLGCLVQTSVRKGGMVLAEKSRIWIRHLKGS